MSESPITADIESLKTAIDILNSIFDNSELPKNSTIQEWDKWKSWYVKQRDALLEGSVKVNSFFSSLFRIKTFLLSKEKLPESALFSLLKEKRERVYNLAKKIENRFSWEEGDIDRLSTELFSYLTKPINENIERNKILDTMLLKRKLLELKVSELLDNSEFIQQIDNGSIEFPSEDIKSITIGYHYLENDDISSAKLHFEYISNSILKSYSSVLLAVFTKDENLFKESLVKAFPETFEPERSGTYIKGFAILPIWKVRYEVDSSNERYISFAMSSGIYEFRDFQVFKGFLNDLREESYRKGLWIVPGKDNENFLHLLSSRLAFQRMVGWKEFYLD